MPTAKYSLRSDGILDPEGKYKNPLTGQSYSDTYRKEAIRFENGVNKGWSGFRIWADRYEILNKIHNNQIVLIIAPPGVGKTVIVPKLLLHYFNYEKAVICTVPKQKIASEHAEFAGLCMDVPIANRDKETGKVLWEREKDFYVGYKFGDMLKPKSDSTTKLLFSTDGLIKVIMTKGDPDLKGYGGIIIDEAHERNVNIDVLFGLIAQLCKRRPEFKVIIMSATVSSAIFINYFKYLGLDKQFATYEPEGVPGNYNKILNYLPVDVPEAKTLKYLLSEIDNLLSNNTIMDKLLGPDNINVAGKRFFKYGRDILGFVASGGEAVKIKKIIDSKARKGAYKYRPFVLIFTKDTEDYTKDVALKENGLVYANEHARANKEGGPEYVIKVILATPIVESSITFNDPLAYVFDTGRDYRVEFDPKYYGVKSYKRFIAQSNIIQRCGRTGRTNDGHCMFMYSKNQYEHFKPYQDPEILTADITDDLLGICLLPKVQTIDGCLAFLRNMIEPLENYEANIITGFRNLMDYDCIDNDRVSIFAKICGAFGKYNYNIVRLVCMGYYTGSLLECIYMGGILANVKSFVDMFRIPVGLENDPDILRELRNILKQFAHPLGEHLSLLNLFMEWVKIPTSKKRDWEKKYKVHGGRMFKINMSIKSLTQIIIRNLADIKALDLIKIYPAKQTGGSLDLNIRTQDLFTLGSLVAKPGCVSAYNKFIDEKEALHMSRGGNAGGNMFGGANSSRNNNSVAGGDEEIDIDARIITKQLSSKDKKLKTFIESPDFSMRGMFLNTSKTGSVDLGPIQSWSLDERILVCIYFAYYTHLAIYKSGYDYVVKYSPVTGNIRESVLVDVYKMTPNFVVYHEFSLSEERGNELAIASHLPHKILNAFMQARTK